ncbi:hypothetical protein THMIRHAS_24680 [Thiosulfatimonas sediminis]|uniref:Uncharacterized protein n=1 Tax=Thiosulfatimonas sediminis TaxID=2675054 RepID=A0A6F8PY85_9GAMM|nr:hypothetical protein [Thiosulfatimonas sediminis]BBP47095.1 hypothetical protein THMIRHAS_24680 [Thiosulfatimonas sediminis]
MQYLSIDPEKCDGLRDFMQLKGWQLTHQDVGQTELCGYGYVIKWEKDGAKVLLQYEDRQGKAMANIELSPSARSDIDAYLAA